MPALSKVQFRRGTAASWAAANPVLALGEPGYATDTGQEKVGDGVTAWLSLPVSGSTTFATPAQVAAPQTTLVRNSANGKRWRSYVDDTGTSKVDPATIPGQFAAGGFYNAIAVSPTNTSIVVAGGDNGGIQRSIDAGQTWRPANGHVTALWHLKVGGFAWHPTIAGAVYAVLANATNAILALSVDYGKTWTLGQPLPATNATTSTAVGVVTDGDTYPRQAGRGVVLVRPSTSDVYVGTTTGVYKYAANVTTLLVPQTQAPTANLLAAANPSKSISGMAFDAVDDAILYLGANNAGSVQVVKGYVVADSNAAQVSTQSALSNSTYTTFTDVQDMVAVSEAGAPVLYVAAGTAGVRKYTRPNTAGSDQASTITTAGNWTNLTGSIPAAFRAAAIDVVVSGGVTRIAAGHAITADRVTSDTLDAATLGGTAGDSYWDLVLETVNAGVTWTVLPTATSVSYNIGGSTGAPWWLMTVKGFYYRMGGQGYKVSQLSYTLNSAGTYDLWSTGKAGIWRYLRSETKWYPHVNGLGIIIAFDVAVDPTDAKKVAVACNDWTVIGHTARLNGSTQPTMMQPSGMDTTNGPITAFGVEFGQSGSILGKLYAATGKRDDTGGGEPGEVYRWDNPWTAPTTATALGFSSVATGNSSGGPAVGRIQGVFPFLVGSVENVLAYVSGSGGGTPTPGIWLKVGSATPTQVLTLTANPAAFDSLTVRFVRDANGVFGVYIPDQGLYTCADGAGVVWTKRISTTTTGDRHVGRLALDPTSSGRWYLTTDQGGTTRQLLKLTVATNGTLTSTDITPSGILPAGVTVDPSNGDVWIRQQADSGSAKLLVSAAGGASFSQVLDDGFAAQVPFGYASRHDGVGNLYVTTDGIGVATGATRSY